MKRLLDELVDVIYILIGTGLAILVLLLPVLALVKLINLIINII